MQLEVNLAPLHTITSRRRPNPRAEPNPSDGGGRAAGQLQGTQDAGPTGAAAPGFSPHRRTMVGQEVLCCKGGGGGDGLGGARLGRQSSQSAGAWRCRGCGRAWPRLSRTHTCSHPRPSKHRVGAHQLFATLRILTILRTPGPSHRQCSYISLSH